VFCFKGSKEFTAPELSIWDPGFRVTLRAVEVLGTTLMTADCVGREGGMVTLEGSAAGVPLPTLTGSDVVGSLVTGGAARRYASFDDRRLGARRMPWNVGRHGVSGRATTTAARGRQWFRGVLA
jgi:hypothetical protein